MSLQLAVLEEWEEQGVSSDIQHPGQDWGRPLQMCPGEKYISVTGAEIHLAFFSTFSMLISECEVGVISCTFSRGQKSASESFGSALKSIASGPSHPSEADMWVKKVRHFCVVPLGL